MSTPTHSDLARMYCAGVHGNKTIFTRGQWHRYAEGIWTPIHKLIIQGEIRQVLEAQQQAKVRPTMAMTRSVEGFLRDHFYIPDDKMDSNPNLVCLQNGVYNLENNGGLLPHNPKHYITTKLNFDYSEDAEAPLWNMYLRSSLVKPRSVEPDQELASFVQEAVGYSLTVDVRHHCSFWCYGGGSNGKGVMFHLLMCLAGSSAIPFNVGLLKREQYQLATLAGKRVALCSEVAATQNLVEDALIKSLVGGDPQQVRQIRQEPFTLYPTVKLWWAVNTLPAVADTSKGFWRRVHIIPFNRSFGPNERILDLKERLEKELPGIFLWAMEGLHRLHKRGKFETPTQVEALTTAYQHESNPVLLFIEDKCDVDKNDPDCMARSVSLYALYKDWCNQNTYKPRSSRNFKREMERLGFYAKRGKAGVFFQGVKEKPVSWGSMP